MDVLAVAANQDDRVKCNVLLLVFSVHVAGIIVAPFNSGQMLLVCLTL